MKLTKEQCDVIRNECNLQKYQVKTIINASKELDFNNSIVLEVGGSNIPKRCVFDVLNVKKWVCVDLVAPYQLVGNSEHYDNITIVSVNDDLETVIRENDYVLIKGDIADIGNRLEGMFDICISLCAFEHIHRLNLALHNIYSSLKTGGTLYTEFGPIYSCKYGSHYWYSENSNFNNQEELLDYKHLLLDNMELLSFLLEHYEIEKANEIHRLFATSDRINRLFYEDYEKYMELSDFKDYKISSTYELKIEEEILQKLIKKYPNYKNFTTYSMRIIAKK